MENAPNQKPDLQVNQSGESSAGSIAIIVAAIALVVGAFIFFINNGQHATVGPQVTQNNTTLPAPINEVPAAPAPATAPASQTTTPPYSAPATNP